MRASICFLLFDFFFFAIILHLFSADATSVQYCDKNADYAVKVSGVDIHPNPVGRGRPANFSISATTDKGISNGKLPIDIKYFGIHIHQETNDLCKETSCPVSSGDFVIFHKQILPANTPPGSYTLQMKLLDDNNNELTCFTFDFKIRIGSSVADS